MNPTNEKAKADDAAWFKRHGGRHKRVRRAFDCERIKTAEQQYSLSHRLNRECALDVAYASKNI
jgi:hypothetical protein